MLLIVTLCVHCLSCYDLRLVWKLCFMDWCQLSNLLCVLKHEFLWIVKVALVADDNVAQIFCYYFQLYSYRRKLGDHFSSSCHRTWRLDIVDTKVCYWTPCWIIWSATHPEYPHSTCSFLGCSHAGHNLQSDCSAVMMQMTWHVGLTHFRWPTQAIFVTSVQM